MTLTDNVLFVRFDGCDDQKQPSVCSAELPSPLAQLSLKRFRKDDLVIAVLVKVPNASLFRIAEPLVQSALPLKTTQSRCLDQNNATIPGGDLSLDGVDECRTTPLPLLVRMDGDHEQVPRPVSHSLWGAVSDADRSAIVIGEPELTR